MWNKSFISNCIYKTKQGKVHLKVNELGYKIIFFLFLVPFIANTQETINVGLVDNNEMETLYIQKWFFKKYMSYTPTILFDDSLAKDLKQSEFYVFMGTWCHDTKIFLPKFFKLLDSLKVSKNQITLFNVDEKKTYPKVPIQKFGIKYIPTVVFVKDDVEVGRIVEFPFLTIEEDISKIYAKLKK